jgi:hypothetical protein
VDGLLALITGDIVTSHACDVSQDVRMSQDMLSIVPEVDHFATVHGVDTDDFRAKKEGGI